MFKADIIKQIELIENKNNAGPQNKGSCFCELL